MNDNQLFRPNVQKILDLSLKYNLGHIPSALSMLPIVESLVNIVNSKKVDFICGKAYGVQAYCVAWNLPYIEHRPFLCKDYIDIKFSDLTLGNALGYAIGNALANPTKTQVVLISDAVYKMGRTREQLHIIMNKKLKICTIVDCNNIQLFGKESATYLDWVGDKFCFIRCGKKSPRIDWNLLYNSPGLVLYDTIKGDGVKLFEDFPQDYHYSAMTDELYQQVIEYERNIR